MEEAVRLILAMWTEKRTTFRGRYFHVEDAILEPKPVQRPRPPVMIAGGQFKPIEFNVAGLRRSVAIRDILAFEIEGVTPRNRADEPFYIDNAAHPANRRLALARSKETHGHGFNLDMDMVGRGNNGHFAPFAWSAQTLGRFS